MAGLCAPLSTLRQYPRGYLRMTRGRCGSLLLHRDGLAPSTPCRSPGALQSTPISGHSQGTSACLKRTKSNPFATANRQGNISIIRGHLEDCRKCAQRTSCKNVVFGERDRTKDLRK